MVLNALVLLQPTIPKILLAIVNETLFRCRKIFIIIWTCPAVENRAVLESRYAYTRALACQRVDGKLKE
jgi:hypothetical protein